MSVDNGPLAAGAKPWLPLISVVCPVYNSEKYLPECINSVLSQSYENLELVLVDDGSVDRSLSVCQSAKEQHPDKSIIVVSKQNSGAAKSREIGIGYAHGELIMFMDSDDYYLRPDAVAMVARAYVTHGFDICLFNLYHERWGCPGIRYPWETGRVDINELRGAACTFRSPDGRPCDMGYAVVKAFRPRIFPVFEGKRILTVFEDTLMTLELLDRAETAYLINEELYFYRENSESAILNTEMHERIRCCDVLFSERNMFMEKWALDENWRRLLPESNQSILIGYLDQIAELPEGLRLTALVQLRRTSLCKDWLDAAFVACRADKSVILRLLRNNRLKSLSKLLPLRRRFIMAMKAVIRKASHELGR